MRAFADLYTAIDETNRTTGKVEAMAAYFASAPPEDAAWAVSFLIGRRPKRLIQSGKLWTWAAEISGVPPWLFAECYDAVGDLAETIALVLPDRQIEEAEPDSTPLHVWVEERLLPLGGMTDQEQYEAIFNAWHRLDRQGRFVYNKLITGAFRVGVSRDLVVRALAKAGGLPAATLAHRLMGDWSPTADFYQRLLAHETEDTDHSRPYPFCLAHPLEHPVEELGEIADWHAEWKWDGIRAQVIRRRGESFVWSRGEDLVTDRFPEIRAICDAMPDGTVVDGEIMAWSAGRPLKFIELQKRIGRKLLSRKILQEVPVSLVAYDLLEESGVDLRERPLAERRQRLEALVAAVQSAEPQQTPLDVADLPVEPQDSRLVLSPRIQVDSWADLRTMREASREQNVEGLMLKRLDSPYLVGRKKGLWWKWKVDPLTFDAVLMYAQRGSGKRASLYTDYTFGVWDDQGGLVPIAKAYSGLDDSEIARVDAFVRRHSLEKFGPVRVVKPELVMELAFEAIQLSSRHKSGIAVRFPRILRWRHDKRAEDADTLERIKSILKAHG